MIYKNIPSTHTLSDYIKSFWLVDSVGDSTIRQEKIIPDGYPEMIFHYGDRYRANISGKWNVQSKFLIAGQITNHFFLENTGVSGMMGIKFQPWAIKELFGFDMHPLVNKVIPFPKSLHNNLKALKEIAISEVAFEDKVNTIEKLIIDIASKRVHKQDRFQKSVMLIINSKGALSLNEIRDQIPVSERGLERYFKYHIGLSPKHYSRIIRFSNIFTLVQQKHFEWTDVSFLAGFYDQSHFIKNFKEFTGEEPSKYGFNEINMANLFLKQDI